MKLRKAEKKQVKLKIGLSGASGFGKTYSALLMAYGITQDWSKIAVIDTENDSASLYSDLGEYNVLNLQAPYSPERYIEAIDTCIEAGIELIIIDSISHEWDGVGGCLEIVDSLGGRFQDWAKVTPRHQKFINKILQAPAHIITTTRRKQEYEISRDSKGKTQVQKMGTKEVTREGFEYELTLSFDIINDKHLAKASKDRTGLFMDKPEALINQETGENLLKWATSGKDEKAEFLKDLEKAKTREEVEELWKSLNKLIQADPEVLPKVQDKILKLSPKQEEKPKTEK